MKPGKYDKKYSTLITGAELQELQRHVYLMAESFGLDRRIERYQGQRPLGLYRWDWECLLDVLEIVLADRKAYPSQKSARYLTLQNLHRRLKEEYLAHYENDAI